MTDDRYAGRRDAWHRLRREIAGIRATPNGYGHPKRLVAMVLVDGQAAEPRYRASCCGALVVDLVDEGPRFALHHYSTGSDGERDGLFARVRELSDDRHVVLGSAHSLEVFADHCHILLDGLFFLDIIDTDQGIQPAGLTLLSGRNRRMNGLASTFSLPLSDGSDFRSMEEYASVRAQVTWLAYVRGSCDGRLARSLFAAYRAWQVLERARPLPF